MPQCKKCDKDFPWKIVVDGKERLLNRRKYCLDCSPFGKHNTKQIHIHEDTECMCSRCNKKFEYERGKSSHSLCKSCMTKRRHIERKTKLVELAGGECQSCGYNKIQAALTFHHLDPTTKKFTIGGNYSRKWSDLVEEINKCILVCHNCHTEIHEGIIEIP